MKTKIFSAAASAALLLTACSQDEAINAKGDNNGIVVRASVGANSRASESYCPEILPQNISMTALHLTSEEENAAGITVYDYGNTYFENASLVKADGEYYKFADGSSRYWPKNKLGILAWYAPEGVTVETYFPMVGENPATTIEEANMGVMFKNFTVAPEVENQGDLLYELIRAAEPGKDVEITLKHALSQVVFSAMCENSNLKVEVKKVGISGLHGFGDYHWGGPIYAFGDALYQQGTGNASGGSVSGGTNASQIGMGINVLKITQRGWVVPEGQTPDKRYMIDLGEGVTLTGEKQALTSAPENHVPEVGEDGEFNWSNWKNVMQLIPQASMAGTAVELVNMKRSNARRMTGRYREFKTLLESGIIPSASNSASIVLQCKITTTNDDGSEVVLYNDTKADGEAQYLYIPVDFLWQPGYRYVYTINFGKGTMGGFSDEPDPTTPTDPVLTNIGINISVKEYSDEDITNEMKYQPNQAGGTILNGSNQSILP